MAGLVTGDPAKDGAELGITCHASLVFGHERAIGLAHAALDGILERDLEGGARALRCDLDLRGRGPEPMGEDRHLTCMADLVRT